MIRYRFPDISATEAGCTVCGRIFIDAPSFDIHRGIRPQGRRGDEAQDLCRCMTPAEMERKGVREEPETGRWGSREARERTAKLRGVRAARDRRVG